MINVEWNVQQENEEGKTSNLRKWNAININECLVPE